MDTVLEPLIRSPKLPAYVQELSSLLTSERERREKFYEELTEDIKAEFINGEVFMHSPARRSHILATGYIYNLLHNHVSRHQLGEVLLEKALVCLTRNDYEPDVLFYGKDKAASFTLDQIKHPAPDFVVEVLSETTEKNDRGVKFEDYAAHGVAEYWLVDPDARTVEQFCLESRAYRLHRLAREGDRVASVVVAGFDIPVAAIFDEQANRRALLTLLGMAEKA
ncbi:MAG: Uma2 family endonuclease [Verrucomicrobia bacterium]|nr:Uma2 family endonuclease [Verrucomicrobiota bacterium]